MILKRLLGTPRATTGTQSGWWQPFVDAGLIRVDAGDGVPGSAEGALALRRGDPERVPLGQGDHDEPRVDELLHNEAPAPRVGEHTEAVLTRDAAELDLRPAMTLASEIIAVQDLVPGDSVGYGCTFTAERPMRVGIVACGYADGYPRHAPTGTPVLVEGVRTRTLGRVSMDKLCVDLTDLPATVGAGGMAVLWGQGLPADEVAAAAGTISYELFCALAQRVPVIMAPG